MRNIIDMDNQIELGYIDWEFIHDMQGIAPKLITPEYILLSNDFLKHIPKKWDKIRNKLTRHFKAKGDAHLAISDVENLGDEFKIRGTLHDKKGAALAFHKVVIYDEDTLEDDFIGAVITDKDGVFVLAFGKKTFSDFGMEAEPDIYFKIFFWKAGQFHELKKIMPEFHEKSETSQGKFIFEFGVIEV